MESGRTRAVSQLRRFVAVVWWYWVGWLSVEPDPKAKLMGFPRTTAAGPVPLGVQHFFLSKKEPSRSTDTNMDFLNNFQTSRPHPTAQRHIMSCWFLFQATIFFCCFSEKLAAAPWLISVGESVKLPWMQDPNFKWIGKYLEFLRKKKLDLRSQLTTMFCGSDLKISVTDWFWMKKIRQNPGFYSLGV